MSNNAIIEQFVTEGLAGKSPNTVKAYRNSLEKFAEYLAGSGADLTSLHSQTYSFI